MDGSEGRVYPAGENPRGGLHPPDETRMRATGLGSPLMPRRLRPTSEIHPDAILVGDPGRAMALAQVLTEQPRMANHARGLWGYSGTTADGRGLSVQSTGMGGPS